MIDRRLWISLGAVLAMVIAFGIYQAMLPPTLNGASIEPPKPMPDFTLQSARGPVKVSDFRGKLVVVFFGFTNCTDVCPMTMTTLRRALDKLGDQAGKVQVLFISVDYGRDTPEVVDGYASNFRPEFIGLAGTKKEIDLVTSGYGIYYELDDAHSHNGGYDVVHTDTVQVLDGAGNLVLTWSTDVTPDEMASDLKVLIRKWLDG